MAGAAGLVGEPVRDRGTSQDPTSPQGGMSIEIARASKGHTARQALLRFPNIKVSEQTFGGFDFS